MTESVPIQIALTSEFQRKLRNLAKRYRKIRIDLQPVLEELQTSNFSGDRISGIDYEVIKVRIKNSDIQKGKSAGYRLIYWVQSSTSVVLLDIYSKSDQSDVEVAQLQRIIKAFQQQGEEEQSEED